MRGATPLDAVLDLHGLTAEAAHDRLAAFLGAGQARGDRLVLIITGKGRSGEGGVLRRSVPHWLTAGPLRHYVAGLDEARAPHGGAGAFYVRLRRPRRAEPG
jgi:DNA-nicking Smr family endonuclease